MIRLAAILLVVAGACDVQLDEGRYRCADTADCPSGWVCESNLCFRMSSRTDAGNDTAIGVLDSAVDADASFVDAPNDVAMLDSSFDANTDATCTPGSCDDGNPCTDDVCEASGCVSTPNTAGCNDGSFCNGADTCAAGTCTPSGINPCGGSTVCDADASRCVGCRNDSDCPSDMLGAWGSCSGATTCAQTGTQSRTRMTFSCNAAMECVGSTTTESQSCSLSTNGISCGAGTTCGTYDDCNYTDDCDEAATQSRTCTVRECSGGTCQTSNETQTQTCTRNTDGVGCSDGQFCNGVETCLGGACRDNADPCPGPCDETGDTCIVTTCGPGISSRDCANDGASLLGDVTRSSEASCHSYCETFSNTGCCEYNQSGGRCRAYSTVAFDDGDGSESFAACTDQRRTCTLASNMTCSGTRLTTISASLVDCRDNICEYARGVTCCLFTSLGSSCSLYTGIAVAGSSVTSAGPCVP